MRITALRSLIISDILLSAFEHKEKLCIKEYIRQNMDFFCEKHGYPFAHSQIIDIINVDTINMGHVINSFRNELMDDLTT